MLVDNYVPFVEVSSTGTDWQWVNSIQRSKALVTCLPVRIQGKRDEVEAHSPVEQLSHELALRFASKVRRCLFKQSKILQSDNHPVLYASRDHPFQGRLSIACG